MVDDSFILSRIECSEITRRLEACQRKMIKQLEFKVEIHLGKIYISGEAAHTLTTDRNKLYLCRSVGAKSDCRAKAETPRVHVR